MFWNGGALSEEMAISYDSHSHYDPYFRGIKQFHFRSIIHIECFKCYNSKDGMKSRYITYDLSVVSKSSFLEKEALLQVMKLYQGNTSTGKYRRSCISLTGFPAV